MLTRRIIPCLDCRDGRVVKGVRFSGLRDAGCPVELARRYEADGADELVLLDVSATPEGRSTHAQTVERVRQGLSIPLTVGGGVRSVADAQRLLEAGADKVAVNTAAVRDPQIVTQLAARFGSQCVVLAADAARRSGDSRAAQRCDARCDRPHTARLPDNAAPAGAAMGWEVVVLSGSQRTGIDLLEWCAAAVRRGAGEILLTSWDRDGTRSGYDLPLLSAVAARVSVPLVASGGAARPADLWQALQAGADAVLAASIFHDGDYSIRDVKAYLAAQGAAVRQ